jgi:NAD(P)-dependent dehydrogenase (short-subunit alcohol dehydrogenase family)
MATIIVAGGATGIGRASVEGFRARGDDVLLIDHRIEAGEVAAQEAPGRCVFLHRDLSDPAAPREAVEAAIAAFGSLDSVLVTAALMTSAPLADWTDAMWDETLALNIKMPFFFAQAAAPYLAQSDNPSIIFISSTAALRGNAGMPAYHATKSALPGLARSLTAELAPLGIRINCVLPGSIDTPFNNKFWDYQADPDAKRAEIDGKIPLRRHGEPDEVSGMILFLTSPAGRYVAGTSIVVDGGYTAV